MNIFVLDLDPYIAASTQCDQHVVANPLATAKILSTVIYNLNEILSNNYPIDSLKDDPRSQDIYKSYTGLCCPIIDKYPCVDWASKSYENFKWLLLHGSGLQKEYNKRYGKYHKAGTYMKKCTEYALGLDFPETGLTPFAQDMPDGYKVPNDPVEAYRNLYKYEKVVFAKWKHTKRPDWMPPQ